MVVEETYPVVEVLKLTLLSTYEMTGENGSLTTTAESSVAFPPRMIGLIL